MSYILVSSVNNSGSNLAHIISPIYQLTTHFQEA